ncbi:acyl-CoA dehydrogenase family protein [Nocardia sp. alder85J]|uniref:acyl-CoA dehydrogenase family protein n=1 Tax=Nocardia sp. alder85J TaxID=2862949 RepID=UPI001CD3AD50|nr:acyl-CoA dehydrogenase family protein [Nocardia sp. alder85J]MCX4096682.1 acyl-CoA dehydrogenase family protein [Nocardia sp. alder85J]
MIDWNEDDIALHQVVDGLADKLSADHIADDATGTFRRDKWQLLAALDIFGLPADPTYGGLGRSVVSTMGVLERLGQGCRDGGLAFSVATQLASSVVAIGRFGSPAAKALYLPALCAGDFVGAHAITEASAGSDAMGMRTTATIEGDTVVLNGAKTFVSNGPIADIIVVYARNAAGGGLTTTVVPVDTPGVQRGAKIEKMGLRTSPMCELFLDDVVVPADHILNYPGNGYFVLDYVMKREILFSFIINVGEMKRRVDDVSAYTTGRIQFGSPISRNQAVGHSIADMKIASETARKWLYDTAEKLMNNRDVTIDIAISKIVASEAAVETARAAIQLHGGYGFMAEYGVEKDLRNAIAGTIYSGSTEIQKNKIMELLNL